jgi:hypothetical protein
VGHNPSTWSKDEKAFADRAMRGVDLPASELARNRMGISPTRHNFQGRYADSPAMQNALANNATHNADLSQMGGSPLRRYWENKQNFSQQQQPWSVPGMTGGDPKTWHTEILRHPGTQQQPLAPILRHPGIISGIAGGVQPQGPGQQPGMSQQDTAMMANALQTGARAQAGQGAMLPGFTAPGMPAQAMQSGQAQQQAMQGHPGMQQQPMTGSPAQAGAPKNMQQLMAPAMEAWQKLQQSGGDPKTWHKGMGIFSMMRMMRGMRGMKQAV